MTISIDECYRAFETRDPAYDGRFYVGVTTTGVYCRPTCAGRPKRENVRFYRTAAAARSDGFRACLRCHPDEV
jgi:methylphosphotriester-DNA--protein-cysteine methyltransferase